MQTVSRLIDSFIPEHYTLSLTIDRTDRKFHGLVTINGTSVNDETLRVHAKDIVIDSVLIDGKKADFSQQANDELELRQDGLLADKHVVVIGFSGTITDTMHGMYPCYFDHEGIRKELIATQFESHHAREVFPCVDEPAAKATFDLTLTTELDVTVLSNMPMKNQVVEHERLVTSFDTTPRMSSYLLAWVVGEMHKKTSESKGGVEVSVWATLAQSPESLDFALDHAVRTIDFFDEYFGVPYPLPKSDHVALPDFSSGAMENWGLITYREIALLADPKTTSISSKRYVATVIAHELSHQWFGNLVTMKWWNNLWLNESFANLMEYVAVDGLHPEWNIWLDFSSHETIVALRRDAIDGVQAVQTEVNHPDEISTLFDGAIVYAKGGRLLRMLQHYIGHEAFRAGLKNYFEKHAYLNTEGEDLWAELSAASGKDISDFMNRWISQPGFPVLHVKTDGISQERFFVGNHEPSSRLWPIPLVPSSPEDSPELLEKKEMTFPIADDERFNVGDTAHFITHYLPDHLANLLSQVEDGKLEAIDRLQLLHEQTMLARGNVIPSADLIPLLQSYKNETVESVWDIMALALGELKKFVETDKPAEQKLRELSRSIASKQYERLGWHVMNGEPETDTKLRATILGMTVYGELPDALEAANDLYDKIGFADVEPEIRALIISTKVRHFESDAVINELLEAYKTTHSADLQMDICVGITSSRNPETIKKLLTLMQDAPTIRPQDVFRWFVYLIRGRESRQLGWQWMKDSWDWIVQTYGGDKSFDDFPRYAASGLRTREQLDDYKAFFTPKMEIPALKRVIQMGISEIEARVELIEHDGDKVRQTLIQL